MTKKPTHFTIAITASFALLLAAGCGDRSSAEDYTTSGSELEQDASYPEVAVHESEAALESLRNFSVEQKEHFLAFTSSAADSAEVQWTQLKNGTRHLTGSAKQQADAAVAELEKAKEHLYDQVSKLEHVGADGWDSARDATLKAWEDVKAKAEAAKNAIGHSMPSL